MTDDNKTRVERDTPTDSGWTCRVSRRAGSYVHVALTIDKHLADQIEAEPSEPEVVALLRHVADVIYNSVTVIHGLRHGYTFCGIQPDQFGAREKWISLDDWTEVEAIPLGSHRCGACVDMFDTIEPDA